MNILSFISALFSAPLSWFTSIFQRSGMISVFLAFFLVLQVTRLLLLPLLGKKDSGSDKASR